MTIVTKTTADLTAVIADMSTHIPNTPSLYVASVWPSLVLTQMEEFIEEVSPLTEALGVLSMLTPSDNAAPVLEAMVNVVEAIEEVKHAYCELLELDFNKWLGLSFCNHDTRITPEVFFESLKEATIAEHGHAEAIAGVVFPE